MPSQRNRQEPPLTWDDLIHIRDSHGLRPTGVKPHKSVRLLHEVYAAWEEEQGLCSGRGYLMPVHLLSGRTRQHLRARGQSVDRLALRALILDALNHPRSGLTIEPRPFRRSAA